MFFAFFFAEDASLSDLNFTHDVDALAILISHMTLTPLQFQFHT
jgi:hypothetical protein